MSGERVTLYLSMVLITSSGLIIGANTCCGSIRRKHHLEDIVRWNSGKFNQPPPAGQCQVATSSRMDCYPDAPVDQQKCNARNCCWGPVEMKTEVSGIPWCFHPSTPNDGYNASAPIQTTLGFTSTLTRKDKTHWPDDIMTLQLDVLYEEDNRAHFKIYDPSKKRFEVPIQTPNITSKARDTNYDVTLTQSPFSLQVTRWPSGRVLFDSKVVQLTFADQFIQIGTSLPTNSIYGLGEHRRKLLIDPAENPRMGFWARDQPPSPKINLYGDHAFYLGLDEDGKAFGVYLLNSNAKEIDINSGNPSVLTYTTIGGILDFYIFTGPSPDDVIMQYTKVIGTTFMPPYWALGFHLCRWGYGGTDGMKKVIHRMRDAKMPYDTQWNDIDYMDNHLDWTFDKKNYSGLPDIVNDLHAHGQHYIMIVDPGISNTQKPGTYPPYDDGLKQGIFIMTANGSGPIIGTVWPGHTAYPDFTNPKTPDYWQQSAVTLHDVIPFDGLWTDMNEPSNFVFGSIQGCPGNNTLDNPPYTPGIVGGKLADRTLCPSAKQYLSQHYNLHSMYGHFEGIASHRALENIRHNRSLVISRSTFPSSGKYVGHWTGDNNADWDNLYYSIPAILNFNMFGIPLVGADICGFMGTTNEELCTRWMQLGAFYPFMRNHNVVGSMDQDPASPHFSQTAQTNMRNVLLLRYTLLPYLYTLFYHSHVNGTMVARPLFFQYPMDPMTHSIDKQFLWGDGLMISPVLQQGQTSVQAYFPNDTWYDYYTGSLVTTSGQVTLDAPISKINVHVRGGTVIPMQRADVTTTASRNNMFDIVVAMSANSTSKGEVFWDDGETIGTVENGKYNLISFSATKGQILCKALKMGYSSFPMMLKSARVFGVQRKPTSVTVNGQIGQFQYDDTNKVLTISTINTGMDTLTITWS